MCGIAGVIGASASPEEVREMIASQRHRGPDDRGYWSEPGAAFGHARLAILDLSAAGHQPMELGPLVIAYNGEIYNFRELRSTLRGPFHSDSDTEVLLHLYREYGDRCVEKLQGMFAFAIWDRDRRRLFAARDRVGLKPFHYAHSVGSFAFASELGALRPAIGAGIDRSAIVDYLTYGYVPAPKTIYRGVHKLPAAHTLVLEGGKLHVSRYWSAPVEPRIFDMQVATEALDALLRDVVRSHLVSDVPVGVFLSGGLDSATTAYYAGQVRTFTLGFDDPAKSEMDAARATASCLGVQNLGILAESGDVRTALDTVARCFGEPFADDAAWSNYLVSQLARKHVTVALSGDGGDELFGGYGRYWKRSRSPAHAARPLLARWRRRGTATGPAALPATGGGLGTRALDRVIHPSLVEPGYDRLWHFRQYWRDDLAPAVRLRWLDVNTSLPERMLTKVDRTSMAHSLEVRPPLLDHRLVEFAFSLDPSLLIDADNGHGKLVLRRLMRQRLPPGHLDRPKQGFGLPIGRWLAEDRKLVAGASRLLMDAHILRRPVDHRFDRAWLLLVLAKWLELNA
jgi:asparagine synthase (glutamine-hydrolysing)